MDVSDAVLVLPPVRVRLQLAGRCRYCSAEVARRFAVDGDFLVITTWGHISTHLDRDHPVIDVVLEDS